jgi:glutamyl-Q tRNA(Asp) synthetase
VPGSADRILRTLEGFGLHWDGEVVYQSRRIPRYLAALEQLEADGHTFQCSCSRRELAGTEDMGYAGMGHPATARPGIAYPGTCRNGPTRQRVPTATRFRVADASVVLFDDRVQGHCRFEQRELGDFVIRRKDGGVAYQLAVVVDDEAQRVSNVVRGADLLPSTGWQMALQRALALRSPGYAHLPLVLSPGREKLGKSRHSVPVEPASASSWLTAVLRLLNQAPPAELERDTPARLLAWAVPRWSVQVFAGMHSVTARDTPGTK